MRGSLDRMDPDEPVAPWFDGSFERWGEGRSAATRRRDAGIRARIVATVEARSPGAHLTPDVFLAHVPMLVAVEYVPGSVAAARAHLSVVSRLVEVADGAGRDPARRAVRAARQRVEESAADRPDDPWAQRIPRRLLQGPHL